MPSENNSKTAKIGRLIAHLACASTALAVLFLGQESLAQEDNKALNDLRLYNFKAANPNINSSSNSTSGTSSSSSALTPSSLDMLDDANTTEIAADPTKTSTVKRPALSMPEGGKTRSVDAEEKILNVQDDFGVQNRAELNVDNVPIKKKKGVEKTPGIPLGTFILRPSVSQSINHETTKTDATATTTEVTRTRGYLQTGFTAELLSDWDLHELKVTSGGAWQKNIYGTGTTKPTFDINAALRLDISRDTIAKLNAGYNYARIETTDPNPVANALVPAPMKTLTGGASIEQKFGLIRGTVGLDLNRTTYGSAELSTGSTLSLADRNQTTTILRGRIGYEVSPILIPFVEAAVGRSIYDQTIDPNGYQRSNMTYALRAGFQINRDEKLSGELSAGLERAKFDDGRLASIDAFTVNGNATWSILRGTDATFGLKTTIDPSTQAGVNGSVTYTANASLSHMLGDNLTARLKGSAALRNYPDISTMGDQTILTVGTGLSWGINRYLDLTGDINYERTTSTMKNNSSVFSAGVGLTLKR